MPSPAGLEPVPRTRLTAADTVVITAGTTPNVAGHYEWH